MLLLIADICYFTRKTLKSEGVLGCLNDRRLQAKLFSYIQGPFPNWKCL